ncbi:hypothetical protein HK096_005972 [Nowakowskiella sp. JEL0078]|nr:hypothetical protein HK096_005972 [Nowakowskiella sp. JEL0078]
MQKLKISTNSSKLHEHSFNHSGNLDSQTTLNRLRVHEASSPLSPAVDSENYPLIPARRFFVADTSPQPNLPILSTTNRTERWVHKTANESGANLSRSRSDVGPRGRKKQLQISNHSGRSRESSPGTMPIQSEQPVLRDLLERVDAFTVFLRKQSWFESRSTKTKPWRERFAVLLPTELHLFRDDHSDSRAYASMPITGATSVTRSPSSSLYILDLECPVMPAEYELWRLQFYTESEMLEWRDEILRSIEAANQHTQSQRHRAYQRASDTSSNSLDSKNPRHERRKFQRETRESDTSTSTLAYDGSDPYPSSPRTPRALMANLSPNSSEESLNPFQGRRNSGENLVYGSNVDATRNGGWFAKSLTNLHQIREDAYLDGYGEDGKPRVVDPVEEIARLRKELEERDRRVKELEGSLQRRSEKKKFGFLGKIKAK